MKKIFLTLSIIFSLLSFNAFAKIPEYKIIIKNHEFSPKDTKIPANQKVKLIIENQDPTAEEFESHDLDREKIVGGNKTIKILVGPLQAGTYKYFGEFNEDTAQGTISVQ